MLPDFCHFVIYVFAINEHRHDMSSNVTLKTNKQNSVSVCNVSVV